MSNMSYCRFQNTLSDLRDCAENFDEPSSVDELRARVRLYQTCQDIVNNYDLADLKEAAYRAAKETERP